MIKYMAIPEYMDIIKYKIESNYKKREVKKMKRYRDSTAPDSRSLKYIKEKRNVSKKYQEYANTDVFSRLYENPMEIRAKHTRSKISSKDLNTKKQKSAGELL